MAYTRKTKDVWYILVNYGHGWEHETTEDTWKEAKDQIRCYRENCSYPVKARKTRETIPTLPESIALDPAMVRR
jgi:hypothetical protein